MSVKINRNALRDIHTVFGYIRKEFNRFAVFCRCNCFGKSFILNITDCSKLFRFYAVCSVFVLGRNKSFCTVICGNSICKRSALNCGFPAQFGACHGYSPICYRKVSAVDCEFGFDRIIGYIHNDFARELNRSVNNRLTDRRFLPCIRPDLTCYFSARYRRIAPVLYCGLLRYNFTANHSQFCKRIIFYCDEIFLFKMSVFNSKACLLFVA